MTAAHAARGLNPFQIEAVVALGDFGELGVWNRSPLVNWLALGPVMRRKGATALLEQVPDRSDMMRLTPFGWKVRAFLQKNGV